jgi:hypothetical protein
MQQQSALIRNLNAVATNTMQVQDFCKVVVGAAVEDAIFRVARDHGLNYKALIDKYKDDVVTKHSSAGVMAAGTCKGVTRASKQCTKRAAINGFCPAHADQWGEDESKRRCVEAYRHKVATAPLSATAALVNDLAPPNNAAAPAAAQQRGTLCKPPLNPLDLL